MSNIGKISLAVEIDGQGYLVALPHERLLLLMKMAEGLADGGKLPVKKFPPGFGFTDLTESRVAGDDAATRCRAAGGMHATTEPESSLDKLAPPAKEKA